MKILVLVLICLLIILYIRHYLYRRQIKNICRRLKYIQENDTNMLIPVDIDAKEINELVSMINDTNLSFRNEIIKYRRKDEMLKEAITNLSHDIRTPLTSLNGYFQLLEESDNAADNKRYMGIIQGRIDVLKALLEELFTYTKLQNDSYELELGLENMQEIIKETVVSFYQEFKAKGIVPEIEFDDGEIPGICSKPAFSRVIYNVIKNAVVHGNQSICLMAKRQGEELVFICRNKVENPEEIDVSHVFDRFYKADKSRRDISTGLGLAIAKQLAVKMNGNIEARLDGEWFQIKFSMPVHAG